MIKIVIGKPGTGKTYHTVRYIVEYLKIQAKKKPEDRRKIFTNISLNFDAVQEYFDARNIDLDVSSVLFKLEEDDLRFNRSFLSPEDVKQELRGSKKYIVVRPQSRAFFWNRIEDKALIIIDEIQKYIGSIKEYGESERQSLVEYFSLHRHKKHDWIFLTQSLMSLSVEVRRVSEQVDELFNVKTMTLPFPLSIPVSDVFIVLRAFGVTSQVYRVRSGYLENSYKVVYEGPLQVVKMTSSIFALYQTHTLLNKEESSLSSGGEQDLPFDLGKGAKARAIKWFIRKHWLHLSLKASVILFLIGGAKAFLWGWSKSVKDAQAKAGITLENIDPVGVTKIFNKDENKEDLAEEEIKHKIIITDNIYTVDNNDYYRGDILNGLRIKDFNTREGLIYESASKVYLDDFDSFDRLCRWLRLVRSLDDSADD